MAKIDVKIKAASDAAVVAIILFHLQRIGTPDDVNGRSNELLGTDGAKA